MGNAVFLYTPIGGDRSTKVDLGRALTAREGPTPVYQMSTTESYGGLRTMRIYSGLEQLSVSLTWARSQPPDRTGAGDVLVRKLRGMLAHLRRGGWVTFCEDIDYAFAAYTVRPISGRATTVKVGKRITDGFAPGVSPVGREFFVRSDPDGLVIENTLCTDNNNALLTFDRALIEDFTAARWVLVREAGTYPFVRLPKSALGSELLTSSQDLVFDLKLPLEDEVSALEGSASANGVINPETLQPGGSDTIWNDDLSGTFGGSGSGVFSGSGRLIW